MAMDQGRVLPDSYLLDVPTDFSGYVAENYDERYRGRVTVREALIQSLNACTVRLLSRGRARGLPEAAPARRPRHPGPAGGAATACR